MSKKLFIVCTFSILATFAAGWETAMMATKHNEFKRIAHAIPIIRFERFDKSRNALIIGLFNPGAWPMEIDHTELFYQANDNIPMFTSNSRKYSDKPLVVDPGDTILVPLEKSPSIKSPTEEGIYWGKLDFRIPGEADFYSVRHRFDYGSLHAEVK